MLASSSHITEYRASILSMPWWIVILLSKIESASITFNVMNYPSQRIPFMWSFSARVTSYGTSSFFVTAASLSSCMPISSLLLSSSGCVSRLSWMAVVLTFHSQLFCNRSYLLFEFRFQHYHISFLCSLTFIALFPLLIIHCKMLQWLMTGRQEVTQHMLCCLCVNWITDVQWPVTSSLWKA